MAFLGADESLVMRTVVSWAWFRPSEKAWEDGARWYRCDIVGGGDESTSYVDLPETAKGLLLKQDDQWMVCGHGRDRSTSSAKVPCTEKHNWRAVTTIKLGEPARSTPATGLVEVKSRDFCSDSVGRLAELPDRLRLRLDLLPRGRVGGRQPPVRLLGEDRPMTRLAAALALVVPSLLAAGCSGSGDAPIRRSRPPVAVVLADARPRRRPRRPPGPQEGACYRLAYDEAVAPTTQRKPVACGREHTATTFHVGTLDAVVDGHLLAVDSQAVQDRVATECPSRFGDFVGGTLEAQRLSMLRAVWFTPTVAAVRPRGRLVPLRRDRAGRQRDPRAADAASCAAYSRRPRGGRRYGMCGTAEPDAERLRAGDLLRPALLAGDLDVHLRRPTATRASRRCRTPARAACEEAGRGVAEDALSFRWGYEWPTEKQWDAGQTYGRCWAPD